MNYRIGFEDGKEGLYLLKEIKTLSPKTVVILMTAFGKVETAVEGLKNGAFDYVLKPWENEKLLSVVKQAVDEVVLGYFLDFHVQLLARGVARDLLHETVETRALEVGDVG